MRNTSSQPLLRIDTTRLYRDGVGAEGIAKEELAALTLEFRHIHQTLTTKPKGGLNAEFASLNLHDVMPPSLPQIDAMAEQIHRFEDVTVFGNGINPLDLPAVEKGKKIAIQLLSSGTTA